MLKPNKWLRLLTAVISVSALYCGTAQATQKINGAGASFPAPLYTQWADTYYRETGVQINYQSIGSSAGVNQIKSKTVDFGASDAPLKDKDLKQSGLIQFPTVIGGIVPVVNIKGIKPGQLKLNGQVLGDIFLGKIQRWNDPAIQALNPGLTLPNTKIAVVRRADGSGTTFVFTTYLSKVNSAWKEQVGAGSAIKWPTGVGGKGNEGVSAFVMRLSGSIGYVEYAHAKHNGLAHVALENADGRFVQPGTEAFQAAARNIKWQETFDQDMTNAPGPDAWPVSTTTFILLRVKADKPEQTAAVLKFFDWVYSKGDAEALALDYVAFPDSVKDIIRNNWTGIQSNDGRALQWK